MVKIFLCSHFWFWAVDICQLEGLKTIAIYVNDCAAAVPFLVNVCCVTMIYCLLAVTAVLGAGLCIKKFKSS